MPTYQHTQRSWWWLIGFAVVVLAFGVAWAAGEGIEPFLVVVATTAIIAVILFVFSRLTVEIEERRLTAAFGLGWPRRTVDLAEVGGARLVRSPWWYGYGIRKIPRGWMWNLRGPHAVEMDLPGGKVVRIGTDEPEALLAALAGLVPIVPER